MTAIGVGGGHGPRRAGEEREFDRLVICAGLSDRLARLAGDEEEPVIVPFRGEYHRLAPGRETSFEASSIPSRTRVSVPRRPFHAPVAGGVDVGPNAVLALAREGYRRRDSALATLWRRSVRRVSPPCSETLADGCPRAARIALKAVVRGRGEPLRTGSSAPRPRTGVGGIRAQALDRDGSLVDDFRIRHVGPVTVVRNAPSPGATSSMAIADHIAEEVLLAT